MNVGKSLTFVFEDKNWLSKMVIGGLITLVTIFLSWTVIGLIIGIGLLNGYMVQLVRNVRQRQPEPLPDWDQWGEKIVLGLRYTVVFILWILPLLLPWLFFIVLSILFGTSSVSDDTIGAVLGISAMIISCLSLVYGLLLALFSPAITVRFAETDDITDSLNISWIWHFTFRHLADVIIAVIVLIAVQFVAGSVGMLLCFIGLFFTNFWSFAVQGHLYGQIGLPAETSELASVVAAGHPADED